MLLAQPIKVKNLTLANRVVMPPMATYASQDGHVTSDICDYYCARAKSQTGLIIVEHNYIDVRGRTNVKQLSAADDTMLPGLTQLATSVHATGSTKIFVQINHAGSQNKPSVPGVELVSASAIPHPAMKDTSLPRELTVQDIAELVQKFADAALRVRKAGFDGVEIHAAHGYLLNQFYSPLSNKRTDAYSADKMVNRLRFHLETIEAVRAKVGQDFPIALRLGGADYMAGGSTLADSVEASRLLESAGIDLLDVSGGLCLYTRPDHREAGWFGDMSALIKKAVHIPVILTGGIKTGQEAETLLQNNVADLIGVGRAMMRDADWTTKALSA